MYPNAHFLRHGERIAYAGTRQSISFRQILAGVKVSIGHSTQNWQENCRNTGHHSDIVPIGLVMFSQ
jgi:hypothetical protein